MSYPQNGDRIVTIDSVMALHPMYTRTKRTSDGLRVRWYRLLSFTPTVAIYYYYSTHKLTLM